MRLCFGLALAFLFTGGAYGTVQDDTLNVDTKPSSEQDSEDYVNNITWLGQISHIVRRESLIDITLPLESFTEECYVRLPNGTYSAAYQLVMEEVKVPNKLSDFVSCRITIGPMTEHLIGDWELCGESMSTEQTRCQRVTMSFDGASIAPPEIQEKHIHPVHFGGSVNTGVSGSSEVLNCHVITPAGEDLVITANLKYPHIERSTTYNPSLCSVVIKDITRDMLGDWLIYGIFSYPDGAKQIGLPLTFKLYNESNPYEQAYNVTNLEPEEYSVRVGTNLTIEVAQKADKVDDCIYISPSGQTFNMNNQNSGVPHGVHFSIKCVDTVAACVISFSPVIESVIGDWQIIGKFHNGVFFDERRLIFSINKEEMWLSQINHFTIQQAFIDISLSKQSFEEECYIRPPKGFLVRADLVTIPGVKVQKTSNYVSCRVTIGPITEDLLGVWRLCGKSIAMLESRCQPAHITWDSRDGSRIWHITNQTSFTHPVHFGGSVNSGVSSTGNVESCHVITPAGEDLIITTDTNYPHIERSTVTNPLQCSVLFKDITRDMLGDWLIYGRFRSIFGQTEVRLPLIFNLYNEDNPYDQAYNTTELQSQDHLVHVGTNLSLEIRQRTGATEDCIYRSPSGQIFSLKNYMGVPEGVYFNQSDTQQLQAVCEIIFRPITKKSVGEWQMRAKFRNGVLFDERRLKFTIIQEDPENPIEDPIQRDIQNLTERIIVTDMNTQHRISINRTSLIENESCHLIDPHGRQYAFIDGFNVPNIEIIHDPNSVECGIILSVKNESMIGNWIILGRAIRLFDPIERRLHFTIRVEENFVLQNDINIREGADLYLHLNGPISVPETCTLFGPDGEEFTNFETDPIHKSSCGYIVRNVDNSHNGPWVVEYGEKIKIRGHVNVEVIDSEYFFIDNLQWAVGDSINISAGPEDAVYCVIQDPFGHKLFDNFGQCKIVLERVTVDHRGTWTMLIGKPGTVRLQRYDFYVDVRIRDGLPLVTVSVEERLPSIMLTCSVPGEHEVYACKFRDPRGNTLIASHGVGQDGYMFNGSLSNYESEAHSHDCTLRLINPSVPDLGIWRCGLDTSTGTYYGFLTVLSDHLMQDHDAAADVSTPLLKDTSLSYLEGEPVTLSCSISSALRYCYFRAQNGTTYNVFPRMSSSENFEYVGAGLDAGECGIRFKRFLSSDAGYWYCHVGLVNTTVPEQQAVVFADVTAKMSVHHYWNGPEAAVVQAQVYNEHSLDYCRFVRTDGFGFISDNVPDRYEIEPTLHRGLCILHITDPDIMDLHPWTIVARLRMGDGEISMTTTEDLLFLPIRVERTRSSGFYVMMAFLCLIPVVVLLILLIPDKNRQWASTRTHSMRKSFSKAFAKKAPAPAARPTTDQDASGDPRQDPPQSKQPQNYTLVLFDKSNETTI